MATSEKDLELRIEGREPAPASGGGPLSSATIAAGLAFVIAAIAAATLGVALNIKTTLEDNTNTVQVAFYKGSPMSGDNYCNAAKPTAAGFNNVDCSTAAVEQAGGNVTKGWTGAATTATLGATYAVGTPITTPFFKAGLCPVNVHWHLGAEHLSYGQYDGQGYGPGGSHRRVTEEEDARRLAAGARLGGRCHLYDSSQEKFTKAYDWKHCVGMVVGETYEVHWPSSNMGACGTPNQYQTPFYDGVFCNLDAVTAASVGSEATGTVALDTDGGIGVQAQVFTIVNDENYYYPDLMRGMIVDGDKGTEITGYTGSTTGTTRSNLLCSKFAPITWHVDRTCHMISASSFDKMCADMKSQRDDMSGDLYAHGAREVVAGRYVANNQQDLKTAYSHA